MREFRSINTGKLYQSTTEYWLRKCPVCGLELFWNSYELEVGKNGFIDIGFDLKVEHCQYCDDYYVHII